MSDDNEERSSVENMTAVTELHDVERVKEENRQLLLEIAQLCNRKDRKYVENILLLGMSGAGKSSLVNTVLKAVAGRYLPKAPVGEGIDATKTLTLTRYKQCAVSEEDLVEGLHKDTVESILNKLPTLIDFAGMGNENSPELRELLELVIGGFIPPGVSIEALQKIQKECGVGSLYDTYDKSNPEWAVSKVVFVQGCHGAVPVNLIDCLKSVLKITDPTTMQAKYTEDVYVVITRYDLVSEMDQFGHDEESDTLSMEEFKNKETEIAKHFNIKGAMGDNRIRWVSYCDTIGKDNAYVDNIALKFLKSMLSPKYTQAELSEANLPWIKKTKLALRRFKMKSNDMRVDMTLSFHTVVMSILILVVAFMLYTFLRP